MSVALRGFSFPCNNKYQWPHRVDKKKSKKNALRFILLNEEWFCLIDWELNYDNEETSIFILIQICFIISRLTAWFCFINVCRVHRKSSLQSFTAHRKAQNYRKNLEFVQDRNNFDSPSRFRFQFCWPHFGTFIGLARGVALDFCKLCFSPPIPCSKWEPVIKNSATFSNVVQQTVRWIAKPREGDDVSVEWFQSFTHTYTKALAI